MLSTSEPTGRFCKLLQEVVVNEGMGFFFFGAFGQLNGFKYCHGGTVKEAAATVRSLLWFVQTQSSKLR